MDWKLADAKNKFSEVVNLALLKGPQTVYRRDDAVVVISKKDLEKIKGKKMSLIEYLMKGPNLKELDLTRDKSPMREAF